MGHLIRRKPVLTHASVVCGSILASVNSVIFNNFLRSASRKLPNSTK